MCVLLSVFIMFYSIYYKKLRKKKMLKQELELFKQLVCDCSCQHHQVVLLLRVMRDFALKCRASEIQAEAAGCSANAPGASAVSRPSFTFQFPVSQFPVIFQEALRCLNSSVFNTVFNRNKHSRFWGEVIVG